MSSANGVILGNLWSWLAMDIESPTGDDDAPGWSNGAQTRCLDARFDSQRQGVGESHEADCGLLG